LSDGASPESCELDDEVLPSSCALNNEVWLILLSVFLLLALSLGLWLTIDRQATCNQLKKKADDGTE
jgi:hypothetical protein